MRLLELNNKDTDLPGSDIFYGVWRQRLRPLGTRGERWISGLAAVKGDFAMLVPADEMAETLKISNAAPAMRVQWHDLSGRDVSMHNAHAMIFEQQVVVGGCGHEGVE